MTELKLVILDVLKPLIPPLIDFGKELTKNLDISVNLHVIERDERTESIEIIIEGEDIKFDTLKKRIEKLGGSIHSIDEVALGNKRINFKDYIDVE